MIESGIQVTGVVLPNGTLQLDSPLDIPAGPVRVVVTSQNQAPQDDRADLWKALSKARATLLSSNRPVMDLELEQYVESLRESDSLDERLKNYP
jgi:hypothetical protein